MWLIVAHSNNETDVWIYVNVLEYEDFNPKVHVQ